MAITLSTPSELATRIAARVREARLARGWTQAELADRSGIPLATFRQFERTGQVSLERLITITVALGRAADWDMLLRPTGPQSLDDLKAPLTARRRGMRRRPNADAGADA